MTAWTRVGHGAVRSDDPGTAPPSIRAALSGQGDIVRGWVVRGAAGLTWFAFALGLAVDSARDEHPGLYYAIGVCAYGAGSVAATLVAGRAARVRPTLRLAAGGWVCNGAAWMLMGWWTSPAGCAVGGLVGGIGAGIGFATITRLIAVRTDGAVRRVLLAGQLMVVESTTAVGMLVGGAVIAAIDVRASLVVTGALLVVTAAVWCLPRLTQPTWHVREPTAGEHRDPIARPTG